MKINLLRQKILDLAIRGKLVPQDPNDEPASVLLERIRAEKERLIAEGKIKRPKKSKATSSESHYQQFEPPFAVPESWEWVRLGEITSKIGSGSTPKGSNYSTDGIPFFRSQNIHNHGIVYDGIKYISDETNNSMTGTIVHAGDLLLNITGGSIGRCAIVPSDFKKGNVSQHVCIIRPIIVESQYIHFYILSDLFWSSMRLTGSGREGLPKYNLEQMLLPIPPLNEQNSIIVAIQKYHEYICQIEQANKNLTENIFTAKSKILDLAMRGKLVPQDPADEPAATMLRLINPKAKIITDNQQYQQLPKNWAITRIGDVVNVVNGKNQKSVENPQGRYPIYGSGGIIGRADSFSCLAGSTIIGRKGSINKPLIIKTNFWNVDTAFGMKPNEALLDLFFYYFCKSFNFCLLDKGSTLPSLTKTAIENTTIPLPPASEQKRIVAKIEELFSVLDSIEASLQS